MKQQPLTLTEEAANLKRLRPKQAGDAETAWANPWDATQESREAVMGRLITDAINSDPVALKRLTRARRDIREGRRFPRDASNSN